MSILSGFVRTRRHRKTEDGYIWQSEDTHESSVLFDDGSTLTEKITAITEEISEISKGSGSHTHSANDITEGTLGGTVVANADSVAALETSQMRNVSIGTVDMIAGETELAPGNIYFFYEEIEA